MAEFVQVNDTFRTAQGFSNGVLKAVVPTTFRTSGGRLILAGEILLRIIEGHLFDYIDVGQPALLPVTSTGSPSNVQIQLYIKLVGDVDFRFLGEISTPDQLTPINLSDYVQNIPTAIVPGVGPSVSKLNGLTGAVRIVGPGITVDAATKTIHVQPGAQGPIGLTGPDGQRGPRGFQGAPGLQGDAGPQGFTGPTGLTGSRGPTGLVGPKGDKGDAGPRGVVGSQGGVGPQGTPGPQGVGGLVGPKGDKGSTGSTGAMGPQGAAGPQGPQGQKGNNGTQGAIGDTGPQGPVGPRGPVLEPFELVIVLDSGFVSLHESPPGVVSIPHHSTIFDTKLTSGFMDGDKKAIDDGWRISDDKLCFELWFPADPAERDIWFATPVTWILSWIPNS